MQTRHRDADIRGSVVYLTTEIAKNYDHSQYVFVEEQVIVALKPKIGGEFMGLLKVFELKVRTEGTLVD